MEIYLLKHNINLESIKQMSEDDVMQYIQILQVFDEIEQEQLEKSK